MSCAFVPAFRFCVRQDLSAEGGARNPSLTLRVGIKSASPFRRQASKVSGIEIVAKTPVVKLGKSVYTSIYWIGGFAQSGQK